MVVPSGRIVAGEPDWCGARLDDPDADGLNLPLDRWLTGLGNLSMGLELNRRFAGAGLVERLMTPGALGGTDYATMVMFGLALAAPAETLVGEGRLTQNRANAIVAYLTAAGRDGSFFAYASIVVAAGQVPPT